MRCTEHSETNMHNNIRENSFFLQFRPKLELPKLLLETDVSTKHNPPKIHVLPKIFIENIFIPPYPPNPAEN